MDVHTSHMYTCCLFFYNMCVQCQKDYNKKLNACCINNIISVTVGTDMHTRVYFDSTAVHVWLSTNNTIFKGQVHYYINHSAQSARRAGTVVASEL